MQTKPSIQKDSIMELNINDRKSQLKKCSGERPAMNATAAKKAVWSLMDDDEDADVELVNPDTLIDEEDLKKPDAGSNKYTNVPIMM